MNILAMDLGKSKTVVCLYNGENSKHRFGKVVTRPQQVHDLLVEASADRIVFEICSIAGWVYDIAFALVNEVEVADVNGQAWRWKNVKSKTDRKDSLKLAQLSSMGQLNCVHIPKKEVRQKRSLITFRQSLVGRRTQIKNSIHSILDKEGLGHVLPKGRKGWTKRSIKMLSNLSQKLEDCSVDSTWRGQLYIELAELERVGEKIAELEVKLDKLAEDDKHIRVLRTIKGVGPRLSEAVAAFLDEPSRFSNGKQVGSYAGLTPRQYQSGQMNRQGRISGQGNKLLRSLLVEVSWLGLRHNSWMRETYQRVLRGSASRKKIAITAVARKLLVLCWAMMRDGTEWREVKQTKDAA